MGGRGQAQPRDGGGLGGDWKEADGAGMERELRYLASNGLRKTGIGVPADVRANGAGDLHPWIPFVEVTAPSPAKYGTVERLRGL